MKYKIINFNFGGQVPKGLTRFNLLAEDESKSYIDLTKSECTKRGWSKCKDAIGQTIELDLTGRFIESNEITEEMIEIFKDQIVWVGLEELQNKTYYEIGGYLKSNLSDEKLTYLLDSIGWSQNLHGSTVLTTWSGFLLIAKTFNIKIPVKSQVMKYDTKIINDLIDNIERI